MTVGLLIGFLLYVNSFYMPLRQLAAVWASFQLALAGLDRISAVLALESNMPVMPARGRRERPASLLAFEHVAFSYPGGSEVLQRRDVRARARQDLRAGRPDRRRQDDDGVADGAAVRSDRRAGAARRPGHPHRTQPEERARKIGFILQEPFLFTGTIRDNILYGNARYARLLRRAAASRCSTTSNLGDLLARFEQGLDTKVTAGGDGDQPGPEAAHRLHARRAAGSRDPDPRRGHGQHRHRDRAAARADPRASCRRRRPRSSSRTA